MPITFKKDESLNVMFEVWDGEVFLDDIRNYWRTVAADPPGPEMRRSLADVRTVIPRFSGIELMSMIQNILHPVYAEVGVRTAIVVQNAVQFGIARQFQALSERHSITQIFYDYDEALEWLLRA